MGPISTEHELADHSDELLDAVQRGELFLITRDGRPIAQFVGIIPRQASDAEPLTDTDTDE